MLRRIPAVLELWKQFEQVSCTYETPAESAGVPEHVRAFRTVASSIAVSIRLRTVAALGDLAPGERHHQLRDVSQETYSDPEEWASRGQRLQPAFGRAFRRSTRAA